MPCWLSLVERGKYWSVPDGPPNSVLDPLKNPPLLADESTHPELVNAHHLVLNALGRAALVGGVEFFLLGPLLGQLAELLFLCCLFGQERVEDRERARVECKLR
jgi:hypothetical protein